MSHPKFASAALGSGAILFVPGLNGLFRPASHLSGLEFPLPAEPQARRLSLALMRIWGIRNVAVGSLIALLWKSGDEKLLAMGLGAGMTLAITDGFVSRSLIGGGATQHWSVPPVLAVIMAGLYGWFD